MVAFRFHTQDDVVWDQDSRYHVNKLKLNLDGNTFKYTMIDMEHNTTWSPDNYTTCGAWEEEIKRVEFKGIWELANNENCVILLPTKKFTKNQFTSAESNHELEPLRVKIVFNGRVPSFVCAKNEDEERKYFYNYEDLRDDAQLGGVFWNDTKLKFVDEWNALDETEIRTEYNQQLWELIYPAIIQENLLTCRVLPDVKVMTCT
jgi:hypothetical protein